MATAEPTRAGSADRDPEEDTAARIRLPAQRSGGDEPDEPDEPEGPVTDRPHRRIQDRLAARPVLFVTAVAAVLHVIWFFVFANSGGDLAAQDAWAEFVGRHPASAYNLAWYGGMHPVSYSVVSPYLMSVLGVRTTMMIAGTLSATLLTLVLIRSRMVKPVLPPAFAGVFGLLCNAISGRVTYGLGTMFALAALAAVFCWPHRWRMRRRTQVASAAVCAGLATAASPVAGLFVGLVAAALFLQRRKPGTWSLGLAPTAVVAASALLFPFSGTQPMDFIATAPPLLCAVVVAWGSPKEWRTVRITAWVYALAVLLTWLISSQIGSNITRLGMLFGGAALIAAVPYATRRSRKWWTLVLSFAGFVVWIVIKTIIDILHTTPDASWARELAPLVHHMDEQDVDKGRVEVVPTRSHREASALAPYVNLARGWNRQADIERNGLFYDGTLNSANYHDWLRRWAVHYVVLPKDDLDRPGGPRERQLIRRGQPYLEHVWGDKNWQLYKVKNPQPLADKPATVITADQDELSLKVSRPGTVRIRIPYSPWLGLVDGKGESVEAPEETAASKDGPEDAPKRYSNVHGCLAETEESPEGDVWTELHAPRAGVYRLAARYQLPRGTACPDELLGR